MTPPADPDNLAAQFTSCTLSKDEWTHEAHLTVGMWHVHRCGSDEALERLRVGIRLLNERHGTPNSNTRGYHETITRAYVQLLSAFHAGCPAGMRLPELVAQLLASPIAARDVLFRFYSRERLMSLAARSAWLEPDVMPLHVPGAVDRPHSS